MARPPPRSASRPQEDPVAIEASSRTRATGPERPLAPRSSTTLGSVRSRSSTSAPRGHDVGDKQIDGVPSTAPQLGRITPGRTTRITIGNWPSGLYFAQLDRPGGVGFAPFVVAPKRLGEHRVAVVMPTHTWQAYNFRDDDGDGKGDTWYATPGHLHRPPRPAVPQPRRAAALPRLRPALPALAAADRQAGRLPLRRRARRQRSGAGSRRPTTLIVFPGHHEYVTTHEYDAVEGYRDRGGNLMFLSAEQLLLADRHQARRHDAHRAVARPRPARGGPDRRPVLRQRQGRASRRLARPRAPATSWMFARNELAAATVRQRGDRDRPHRPELARGTHVLAEIPNLFGPGMTAR